MGYVNRYNTSQKADWVVETEYGTYIVEGWEAVTVYEKVYYFEQPEATNGGDGNVVRQTATGLAGAALSSFDNAGCYLHYLPKSNRLKVFHRPYVNQHTVNTKIGVRGTAVLFLINEGAIISDYRNGTIDRDQFNTKTGTNVLGTISPQFGLMFITYGVMEYISNTWNEYMSHPNNLNQFHNNMNSSFDNWIKDMEDSNY